jgi:pimeloyl-ACP methyl ester carboxylesterase
MPPGSELVVHDSRRHELRGLGDLLAQGLGETTTRIHELHEAIATRVFTRLGPAGAPVRLLHDGISAGAYGAVGLVGGAITRLVGTAAAIARPQDADALSRTAAGAFGIAATSGLIGDRLEREGNALAVRMTLRHEAGDNPTPKLAVFVHGLCETDDSWGLGAHKQGGATYGSRLRADLGFTPVYVRYNTGLPIGDNGRRLNAMLEDVVRDWPVEVEEIALVGHSMGGLVARSAAHHAQAAGHGWVALVKHVFCLGTPHLGAPLEQLVARAAPVLARLPETRPVAKVLEARSAGIRDLHDGFFSEDRTDIPFLEHAQHYAIGATLTRDADSRLAGIVGDLLVLYPSSSGRGRPGGSRSIPFPIENGHHVGGINHFALLNHPAVYEQIRMWLEREPHPVTEPTL